MNAVCCLASRSKAPSTASFELGRIQTNADWILPITALLAGDQRLSAQCTAATPPSCRRFGVGSSRCLRAATFLGLLFLFLQPQWRSEKRAGH